MSHFFHFVPPPSPSRWELRHQRLAVPEPLALNLLEPLGNIVNGLVTVFDTDGGVDTIPSGAKYFLGYDDGNPVIQEIEDRFPGAVIITITTVPGDFNLSARMCDCEANAFSVPQAAYWASQKIKARDERPCIYVEVALKDQVTEELALYGLEFGRDVDCWLAWWNGVPQIPEGIVQSPGGPVGTGVGNIAIQYLNVGMDYDVSVALADWVTPVPPPPPIPKRGSMEYFTWQGKTYMGTLSATGKGVGTELNPNQLKAFNASVGAGHRQPPIPDVEAGYYNFFIVGDPNAGEAAPDVDV